MRTQFYPVGSTVPTFSLGLQDGVAIRDLIGRSRGGQPPPVKIRLDVKTVPNLKTATVWGSLPGTSDETIFVVAHRGQVSKTSSGRKGPRRNAASKF